MIGVILSNPRLLYILTLVAAFLVGAVLSGAIVALFRESAIRRNLRWHRDKMVVGLQHDIKDLEFELLLEQGSNAEKKVMLSKIRMLTAKLVSSVGDLE